MKDYLNFNFEANNSDFVSVYDELPLWSAPFGMTLLETIKLKENAKVLDVGCGTGFPLLEIAGRFGNSSKIYGIDPWIKALERIGLKLKKYNIENVYLINGSAEKLTFENNFFDLVVSNNGINNVDNPEIALNEIFKVLKNDGQFVFTMNLPDTMKEFYDVFEIVLNELGLINEIEKMKEHIFEKRKPVDYMITLIKNAGFKITNAIEKSFNMRFANGTAMLNYHFIKSHFAESWKSVAGQENMERVFELIEKNLNDTAKSKAYLSLGIPYVCFDCNKT
jgi:ubiquinone/menaquinone biosynthesis C-methylase UbiE